MTNDTTPGIPNPDKPGHWLVPPWPTRATFPDVVTHFLRFEPRHNASPAHLLAYYTGYEAALEAVPQDGPDTAWYRNWSEDMRNCVKRCARRQRERRAEEADRKHCAA